MVESDEEEIDLFDEYMNYIRTIKREDKDVEIKQGEYTVGGQAVIINSEGEILISRRSVKKHVCPLMWECNGGAIRSRENVIDGTVREIHEELGIMLDSREAMHLKIVKKPNHFKYLYLFNKDIRINELNFKDGEVIAAKWVTMREFLKMYRAGEIVENVDFGWEDYQMCLELIKERNKSIQGISTDDSSR